MNRTSPVIDRHANYEEYVDRMAKDLGRSKLRTQIFSLIYGRGSRPKSVSEIMEKLQISVRERQLVLNEVNHLKKRRLVERYDVPRKDRGGAERAYGKIDDIMALKEEILKHAVNKKARDKLPTKRRPQISLPINLTVDAGKQKKRVARTLRTKLKILYLTATPESQAHLRTDAEARLVQEALRGSKYREDIDLIISPAADAQSILNGINDHRPTIVHFSGHGGGKDIWLDDGKVVNSKGDSMNFASLADLLGATESPPTLLVLNACDTLYGAEVLLDSVKVVVAMSDSVSDLGAATFAAQFYAAIASAQPISIALRQGRINMKSAMLNDFNLPQMICRRDVNPKSLILVNKKRN
jgi:DNA-binding transcriptional regulator GbsR (MarR family)